MSKVTKVTNLLRVEKQGETTGRHVTFQNDMGHINASNALTETKRFHFV